MDILLADKYEVEVLKEMANYWWSQHQRMYKEVTSYPKEIYKGKHTYEVLMAGERVYRYIKQMG